MKILILLVWLLASVQAIIAADFKKGDSVTLTRDDAVCISEPHYEVVRKVKKGDTFQVDHFDKAAHKVYVLNGNTRGGGGIPGGMATLLESGASSLWIKEDAVTLNARELGGFLGIKWGTSMEAAKAALLATLAPAGTKFSEERQNALNNDDPFSKGATKKEIGRAHV